MAIRDMVARKSDFDDTKDMIPTPPYVTRVFFDLVVKDVHDFSNMSFWDPAAGRGHMSKVADELGFGRVISTDLHDWPDKVSHVQSGEDFLSPEREADFIVTNPPYALSNQFVMNALDKASVGVGILQRVNVLESQKRYELFTRCPPTQIAFFSDRIPFKTAKVVRKAPKMYFHIWMYWNVQEIRAGRGGARPPMWLPPDAQAKYERVGDYDVE